MLGWSLNLFRIRGIQLALHWSFLLLLAYFGYQGYRDAGLLGMIWWVAALAAIFTCVVLHELGHSFTAIHFGVGVRRILLMPIGGMAEFDAIPRQPVRELLITLAGPAVNFAIFGILTLALPSGAGEGDSLGSFADLGALLLIWNLYMGLFNLLPIFPMDGGRILRALLAIRLPYLQATRWAVMIGKPLALIAAGIAIFYFHTWIPAVAFLFIFTAGEAEYRAVRRREQTDAEWRAMVERLHAPPPAGEPPFLGN